MDLRQACRSELLSLSSGLSEIRFHLCIMSLVAIVHTWNGFKWIASYWVILWNSSTDSIDGSIPTDVKKFLFYIDWFCSPLVKLVSLEANGFDDILAALRISLGIDKWDLLTSFCYGASMLESGLVNTLRD